MSETDWDAAEELREYARLHKWVGWEDAAGYVRELERNAFARDTEVRELREKLEAAEHERDEHIASHGLMVKQFKIMQAEKEHGWREAEQTEARIARVEALAESLNASDKWHDVAPMIWAAVGGTSTPDETLERCAFTGTYAEHRAMGCCPAPVVPVPPEPDETPEPYPNKPCADCIHDADVHHKLHCEADGGCDCPGGWRCREHGWVMCGCTYLGGANPATGSYDCAPVVPVPPEEG